MADSIEELRDRLRGFARARDWEQFHTPKNLAMALAGEVGELVAELQWLTPEEAQDALDDPASRARLADELADILIYLTRLADVANVDLLAAAAAKVDRNEERYGADRVRGRADLSAETGK